MKRILVAIASAILSSYILAFGIVHNFDIAQKLAKIEQKKIVLIFEMKTCGYCKLLNSTTLQNEKVRKFLSINYITTIVYADENIELFQKFNVHATPTLWFFQYEKGKLVAITYVPGYLPADLFLKVIKYVYKLPKEKFEDYAKKKDDFIGERKLVKVSKEEADFVLKNDPDAVFAKSEKDFSFETKTYITDNENLAKWLIKHSYRVLLIEPSKVF